MDTGKLKKTKLDGFVLAAEQDILNNPRFLACVKVVAAQ
jgi:hypothetical protein